MKIHRVVQMLGATTSTGKLADDMYDLGHKDYYSEAEGRDIPISHMDFQHLVRAFVKQNDEVKYYKKLAEDNFISSANLPVLVVAPSICTTLCIFISLLLCL